MREKCPKTGKLIGENHEEEVEKGVDRYKIYLWLSGFIAGFGVAWIIISAI